MGVRRCKAIWAVFGLAVVLFVPVGCILPVAWHETPPVWTNPETLPFLKVGETDKEEILWRFGTPQVVRTDGRLWVYAKEQLSGVLWLTPDGLAGGDLHVLVIEFDREERFHSLGAFEGTYGCLDSGVCVITYWGHRGDYGLGHRQLRSADFFETPPDSWSEIVWSFRQPLEGCRIHFYSTFAARAAAQLWTVSANQPELQHWWLVNGPYFVAIDVARGNYRITTSTQAAVLQDPSVASEETDDSIEFACSEPALVFVERGAFGLFSVDRLLRTRSAEQAMKVLREYTLVQQPQDLGWTSGPYRSGQSGPPP